MINKAKRTEEIAPSVGHPAPQNTGKPVFKEKDLAHKKEASKKQPVPTQQRLDIAKAISLIKSGNTKTAIAYLLEYQCKSPESCGNAVFQGGLCFNHYHLKAKYGRVEHVNTKHNGELCSVCKTRPATNRDKCLPCYARIKYHADKEAGTLKKKDRKKKSDKKTAKKNSKKGK